jgi:hypothetical protein
MKFPSIFLSLLALTSATATAQRRQKSDVGTDECEYDVCITLEEEPMLIAHLLIRSGQDRSNRMQRVNLTLSWERTGIVKWLSRV